MENFDLRLVCVCVCVYANVQHSTGRGRLSEELRVQIPLNSQSMERCSVGNHVGKFLSART